MARATELFVDTDVHPLVRGGNVAGLPGNGFFEGMRPYLSRSQQKHFDLRRALPYPRYEIPFGNFAKDALPPEGGLPGSDPQFTIDDHLDEHGVAAAVLSSLEAAYLTAMPSTDDTVVLSAALNDYLIDNWLSVDPRYNLAMGVTPKDPVAAAAEIRRIGHNDQIVAVFVPTCDIAFGNRYFHPIYDAAQEYGLPIFSHVGSGEGDFRGAAALPGGTPNHFAERRAIFSTVAQANISSLVFEGTFERFPKLKFAFVEWGFGWAPPLMWSMDARWRALRPETPWVKRPPSEYVIDHIRFSTQPLDEPEKHEHLLAVLDMIHAEKTVMFATDYPHWDNEFPMRVLAKIPADLKRRMLVDNALDVFDRLRSRVPSELQATVSA